MKKFWCTVVVAAGLLAGCGEPDPSTQPGFVKETAADPGAVIKQMSPDGKSSPKAGGVGQGGAAPAPGGAAPGTSP